MSPTHMCPWEHLPCSGTVSPSDKRSAKHSGKEPSQLAGQKLCCTPGHWHMQLCLCTGTPMHKYTGIACRGVHTNTACVRALARSCTQAHITPQSPCI